MNNIAQADIRSYFKRWPWLYYFIMIVFGPILFTGLSPKKFLQKYGAEGKIINIGSGPRRIAQDVINIDIYKYEGVVIVADAAAIPLPEGSVARIISDNVLEHMRNPAAAVSEMYRLLEIGGIAYIATPFVYPFHSSPNDYQRWTREGYSELLRDFEIVEVGVLAGPFSALVAQLCHVCGIVLSFGSVRLDSLITNLAMFIFFPIKYLDLIFAHWPRAENVAAALYCVIRKK
jgi:SAM-dependent methyltransferase